MSTRCRIAKWNDNGTVTSIYCHHDGYVDGVGKVLVDFYNSDNIDQLLALGDLSLLGNNPVSKAELWNNFSYSNEYCLAYNDRGEDTYSEKHKSVQDYLDYCKDCLDIEYAYILIENKWFYSDMRFQEKYLEQVESEEEE